MDRNVKNRTYPAGNLHSSSDKAQIEQKILSDIGLRHIIDVETLQGIQEKLAGVTGLSMVTVDFKGEPITKETCFSDFCLARREISVCKKNCYFSDAYGGLKAAMADSPYIYRCPAGLVDCAVPIIINGQHLGAVLMGQVRCFETDSLENLSQFIKDDIDMQHFPELVEKYKKTAVLELDKVRMIADLAHFIIKEMVEKQVALLVQREYERKNDQLLSENEAKSNVISRLKHLEFQQTKVELRPQFMLSIMNAISSLSLIEGAVQTNEMTCLFADMIRFHHEAKGHFVDFEKELKNLDDYLKIQQMRLGDKLAHHLAVHCDIVNKKIPPLVLLPFVENAILHGILPKNATGTIFITVSEKGTDYRITIKDDGIGIPEKKISRLIEADVNDFSDKYHLMGLSIYNARRRLTQYFGKAYDIHIDSRPNKGTTVEILIPKRINEEELIEHAANNYF
ncbi:Histidine kinase [Evansella caseinilytica]|uniref:Histidine kinase n=1 Tax=Evansella caseinilytica TaxID=1503961 RepID=A0A1H3HX62_9BACI|nr:PocR ligand-binding domain-containing protein [Evansella caseinilytica]SDY20057.1 Histidine kinase [Evansella caseinilytica]